MGERILVVGTGLIGGSIGLALRASGEATVTGFDRDPEHAARAKEIGAVDDVADDLAAGCAAVDIVVLATPVGQIGKALSTIAAGAPPGLIVTDVGSAKEAIVTDAERTLGPQRPFVGGHPMAGTEGEGIGAARADLFEGALWILTPTDATDAAAFRRVNALVARLGARSLALDPATHDRLVALVSHLPYTLATVLMDLAGDEGDERIFQAAAGSFRDVTRTAGTNPRMWRDILRTNRDALLRELDAFTGRLASFRAALAAAEWDRIDAVLDAAASARLRFPLKGERAPRQAVALEVPVPDRAGVLAEVTTSLGEAGVNIEDIWMDHTPAGGVVRLIVDGRATATRAAERLNARGFRAAVLEGR